MCQTKMEEVSKIKFDKEKPLMKGYENKINFFSKLCNLVWSHLKV